MTLVGLRRTPHYKNAVKRYQQVQTKCGPWDRIVEICLSIGLWPLTECLPSVEEDRLSFLYPPLVTLSLPLSSLHLIQRNSHPWQGENTATAPAPVSDGSLCPHTRELNFFFSPEILGTCGAASKSEHAFAQARTRAVVCLSLLDVQ